MTTEMGPRDVDLSIDERLAARVTRYTTAIVSNLSDDVSARFDPDRATLSLSGESEDSGDAFNRGLLVGLVYLLNVVLGLFAMMAAARIADIAVDLSPALGWPALVPFAATSLIAIVFVMGSVSLIAKTNVTDHTTMPAPEEIQDLQDQYVAGDLDEEEFGERVAEVWER